MQPNIILVMCDDLGYGDTGFNGNQVIRTPHLDRLCGEGTRFTRFHAGGPVCSPTRGTCLTGRHYIRFGIDHVGQGHLPAQEETLAQRLGAEGYRTGHFGKWHLGTFAHTQTPFGQYHIDHLPPPSEDRLVDRYSPPWARGYQRSVATEKNVPLWDPSRAFDPRSFQRSDERYPTLYYEDGRPMSEPIYGCDSAFIMDHAVDFISDAVGTGQPFFTTIWFHAPHAPVEAGPEYLRLYPDCDPDMAHYFGCVTAMDAQMGRLAATLQSLGVDQDTLIWFCSDNGPEGGNGKADQRRSRGSTGGLRGRKRSLYNGGITVPAFIRWPSVVPTATTCRVPGSTLDQLPTVYDYLGLSLPDRPIDGVSLAPILAGTQQRRGRPIPFRYLNHRNEMFDSPTLALIGDHEKFLTNLADADPDEEYYDPIADPWEHHDLHANKPERCAQLRAELRGFLDSCRHSHAGGDYPGVKDFLPSTPFQEAGGWRC